MLTIPLSLSSCPGWISLLSSYAIIELLTCRPRCVIPVIRAGTWDKLQALVVMLFCVLHELPISLEDRVMEVIPVCRARATPIFMARLHVMAYPLRQHQAHCLRRGPLSLFLLFLLEFFWSHKICYEQLCLGCLCCLVIYRNMLRIKIVPCTSMQTILTAVTCYDIVEWHHGFDQQRNLCWESKWGGCYLETTT